MTTLDRTIGYKSPAQRSQAETRIGLAYGLGAYLSWGIVPIYFKLLTHVPAMLFLAHRIVWSALFLALIMAVRRQLAELLVPLRRRDVLLSLLASTLLIALNWYTFIYSVEKNFLLQASLGYFINPLVSVLLGVVFLGERMRPWQFVGLLLAAAGVANLAIYGGEIPWIAIILALSFGFYGLLRKTMHVGALAGLTVETWILFLPALLVVLLKWTPRSVAPVSFDAGTHILLALAGPVTTLPLLMFAAGARRLRLSTMGFLQYLAPSGQFLLAVFLYDEPFTRTHMITFALIWAALIVYSSESYLDYRRRASLAAQAENGGNPPT